MSTKETHWGPPEGHTTFEEPFEVTFKGKFGQCGTTIVHACSLEEAIVKFKAEEWSCSFVSAKRV